MKRGTRSARPIHDILWGVLSPKGRQIVAIGSAAAAWEGIVGKTLAARSELSDIEGEKALVTADSPIVAQEIQMRGASIVKRLREEWGLPVSTLVVTVAKGKKPDLKRKKVEAPEPVRYDPTSTEVGQALRKVSDKVEDEDVALALARLLAAYKRRFGE